MRLCTTLLAALSLSACNAVTKDLGTVGSAPGIYVCAGKATVATSGQALIYGVNGMISFDCGSGAYFGGGYPASNLPIVPSAASPQISGFPPIGRSPTTAP